MDFGVTDHPQSGWLGFFRQRRKNKGTAAPYSGCQKTLRYL